MFYNFTCFFQRYSYYKSSECVGPLTYLRQTAQMRGQRRVEKMRQSSSNHKTLMQIVTNFRIWLSEQTRPTVPTFEDIKLFGARCLNKAAISRSVILAVCFSTFVPDRISHLRLFFRRFSTPLFSVHLTNSRFEDGSTFASSTTSTPTEFNTSLHTTTSTLKLNRPLKRLKNQTCYFNSPQTLIVPLT